MNSSLHVRFHSFFPAALLLISLAAAGCGRGEPPAAQEEENNLPSEPVPVETVKAKLETLRPTLDLVGTIVAVPERMAVVSPQLGGWVQKVHVVEGQTVRAGDVIAALDARLARIDVERAQASVAEKQAALARLKRGYLPQELEVARQDREKARATMEGLQGELNAVQELSARNEMSKVHLEMKQKAYEVARATLASAAAHVKLLEAGTRPEMIAEGEALLDSSKANLEQAKLALRFCSITSPIGGIVVQLLARQGQFFNQASPLATVLDLSEVFVHLRIPTAKYSKVQSGTPVDVEVTSFPGRIFRGTVTRISGEADPLTGDIEVFAVLKNKETLLHPGIGCKAHVWLPEIPNALVVPVAAVADHSGTPVVTIVQDGRAHEIKVELGAETRDLIQIVKGLSSGDQVATAGGYGLPEGCPVRIVADLRAASTASE